MADNVLQEEARHRRWRIRLTVAVITVLAAALPVTIGLWTAREALKPITNRPDVQVFSLTFLSIVFEALPFILIGALLSGMIEMFVSREAFARLVPRSAIGQLAVGATVGAFLPVCECGVVVVVRRLLRKGMPVRMALTYLLAAPIVNPVVILSTFAAFRGKPEWWFMPSGRVVLGVGIAMAVAALVGRRAERWVKVEAVAADAPDPHAGLSVWRRVGAGLDHTVTEFLDVLPYLLIGAAIAALVQSIVPREAAASVGMHPVLGVLAMMALAVGLNLCSEADAFVAAGMLGFTAVARLTFLVLGPMFDLKLLVMYGAVFRPPLVRRLVAAILIAVFVVMTLANLAELAWFGGGGRAMP